MRTSHDAVLRQGAYRLYAGRAGRGTVESCAADRYLRAPPADPGAFDRPDRSRDRRGAKTPWRCSDDRGGAYLYVGARRRQAWCDDVHQPLYRHVPRQSGGAGAFPVHGARAAAVASPILRGLTLSTSADINDIEEGLKLQPRSDASGLVTCVATDAGTGEVLMVAHMNDEALRKTIATGEAWYFSRSRNSLWRKGETSGHVQRVVEMRLDCDQDAVWIKVEQAGPGACHTGRRSCFYRAVPLGQSAESLGQGAVAGVRLEFRDAEKAFDPHEVYGGGTPKSES